MGKDKLRKFAEIAEFRNVVEPTREEAMENGLKLKGKWKQDFFKNDKELHLELACGGGEYTVGLGKLFPEVNFMGLDIKGNRIWKGAKRALEANMDNVAFLRTRIDFITNCFGPSEVDEIWITFPDPQPQKNRARKRLTHPMFLNRYKQFLKPSGKIRLKTDSDLMYEFTLEVIKEENLNLHFESGDIYGPNSGIDPNSKLHKELELKTYYEQKWLEEGKKIKYVEFSF